MKGISRVLASAFLAGAVAVGLFAASAPVALAQNKSVKAVKTPQSISAKLYWIAKLMDKHENWGRISELLREALELDLDNDMVTARLKKVKQYVDREWIRQKQSGGLGTRLDTHTFLEARLLIVECIQEMRPRLNLSWTGEVRHLKKMLFSTVFPGNEAFGKIEFPAPSTYSFDTYGYTVKNLKALMIAPGGEKLKPLFDEFIVDAKKPSGKGGGAEDDDWGTNMQFKQLTMFKDRIYSSLMSEGIDPSRDVLPDGWGGSDDWGRGGWGDDDWDWRGGGKDGIEDKLYALKKAYKYVSEMLTALRNHRSIDDYEPLTLLMIALANPALIEEDPQLKDFAAGVKFKFEVVMEGVDEEKFRPKDYDLVKLVNDALVPANNVKLQYEVDSSTGRTILYIVSNLNGSSNILTNLLSFKNVVSFVQTAKHLPDGVFAFVKATPENISKMTEGLNKMIEKMNTGSNIIYKLIGQPAQVAFDLTITLGGKTFGKAATYTTQVLQKVAAHPRVVKTFNVIKSERFLKTMVALSVAADLTQGVVEFVSTPNPSQRPKIVIHTTSRVASALVYLSKADRVIWTLAALDIGHLVYDKVPSVAQLFEYLITFNYSKVHKWVTGQTPRQKELEEIKKQLEISNETEATVMLKEFEAGIRAATTLDELRSARTKFADKLGVYGARRLVFHYVTIAMLNGKGERDLGEELQNQSIEYDRMFWTWYTAPGSDKPEQAGIGLLNHDYWKKWLSLGGKLPEPKPKSKPDEKPSDDGSKKKPAKKGDPVPPWDDASNF